MKSEPDVFSFADLKAKGSEWWDGVRNYQARNFMRDEMKAGDLILFYHSSCPEPGVAGIAAVAEEAVADPSQFEEKSDYYDGKATREAPRWFCVRVAHAVDLPRFVPLAAMKEDAALAEMLVLRRGNRLSITPVAPDEFKRCCALGGLKKLPG